MTRKTVPSSPRKPKGTMASKPTVPAAITASTSEERGDEGEAAPMPTRTVAMVRGGTPHVSPKRGLSVGPEALVGSQAVIEAPDDDRAEEREQPGNEDGEGRGVRRPPTRKRRLPPPSGSPSPVGPGGGGDQSISPIGPRMAAEMVMSVTKWVRYNRIAPSTISPTPMVEAGRARPSAAR